jgi:S-methylmethionine-dependent homocysteine/selenocysteine methylase
MLVKNTMQQMIENNRLVLMEAAIVERLRRSSDIELHNELLNAPLIYEQNGKKALGKLYQEYVDIAFESSVPILLFTPTWRANQSRVKNANISQAINIDAVHFMQEFRNSQTNHKNEIKIGGLIGCKNDCYKPNEGLSASEAQAFHSWQIEQLVLGGVDYLIAETLPNVNEALGIAKAMETTGIPYIISFVLSRDGRILDGTNIIDAIEIIDSRTVNKPLGYLFNCSFPAFICPDKQPKKLFKRLIGCQANASSMDHCDLDGAAQLEAETVSEWGSLMLKLNYEYVMKILGGCCGTNGEHLRYISGK